ncbi:MAG TPA: hypothetical protein VN200_12245 [Rhodoglobus sp.]|nr:hypothetical protein [Rhodoglobus sp.]
MAPAPTPATAPAFDATPVLKPRVQPNPFQRRWRRVFWWGLPSPVFLLLMALVGFEAENLVPMVGITLGIGMLLLGIRFSNELIRAGADDTVFVKGTTTVRAISIAWIVVGASIPAATIAAVILDVPAETMDGTAPYIGTVGPLSLLAMIGPGYAEHREALRAAKEAERAAQAHP